MAAFLWPDAPRQRHAAAETQLACGIRPGFRRLIPHDDFTELITARSGRRPTACPGCREASINDVPIGEAGRRIFGPRPDEERGTEFPLR
jgi:hypothetical protein